MTAVNGATSNQNAAAIAARQAELARQRAEAARRRAEAARQRAEAARREAEAARQQARQAQEAERAAQAALQTSQQANPNSAETRQLRTDFQDAQAETTRTQDALRAAETRLQRAEESVVRTADVAQTRMREANEVANTEGVDRPFSGEDISGVRPTEQEVADAFDGASAGGRAELERRLGVSAAGQSPEQIARQITTDREYARLANDPASRGAMESLGIENGQDLAEFGEEMVRYANGETPPGGSLLEDVGDPEALQRVLTGAARALPEDTANREIYADPGYAQALINGASPEQAANAVEAQQIYDDELEGLVQKPLSEWNDADAAAFTDGLAEVMERNSDNPELQNTLMSLSQGRLERTAQIIGTASESNDYDGANVRELAVNLSRIGDAIPEETAVRLAVGIANEIDDDSELNSVDDGFKQFITDGGSERFRAMVAGALQHQGRDEAAEELIEDSGGSGIMDRLGDVAGFVGDRFEDLVGGISDAAGAAWDFGGDTVNTLSEVQRDTSNFLINRANDAFQAGGDVIRAPLNAGLDLAEHGLDALEDVAPDELQGTLDVLQGGVDAGQRGLEISNDVQELVGDLAVVAGEGLNELAHQLRTDPVGAVQAAADFVRDGLELLNVGDKINDLGPDDSLQLSASLSGAVLGINGTVTGNMTVTRRGPPNDDYVLRVDGQLGAGLASRTGASAGGGASGEASLTANAGGAIEFDFDSPEEATAAAQTLMGPQLGAVSGFLEDHSLRDAVDGAVPDIGLLMNNVNAIELNAGVSGTLAGSLGSDFGAGLNGSLNGSLTTSARIEFPDEPGAQPEIVLRGSAALNASAGASAGNGALSANATLGGSLVVEQRFSLPEGFDPRRFVTDPVDAVEEVVDQVGEGTTSVTLTGTAGASAFAGFSPGPRTLAGTPGPDGQMRPDREQRDRLGVSAGETYEGQIRFSGTTEEIIGMLPDLVRGDLDQVWQELGNVTVQAHVRPISTNGSSVNVVAGDSIDSAKISLSGTVTDRGDRIYEYAPTSLHDAQGLVDDFSSFIQSQTESLTA